MFRWQEDGKTTIPENHALRTLAKPKIASFTEMIKNLPVEKLEAAINELKKDD